MYKSQRNVLVAVLVLFWPPHLLNAITLPTGQKGNKVEDQGVKSRHFDQKLVSVFSGDGRASDGTFLELNSYQTSSGLRVNITRGQFSSPAAAQHEMALWLRGATQILERSTKKRSGKAIGMRALGVFRPAQSHEEYTAIAWTEGKEYLWVSSPSPELARQVEADLNSHPFYKRLSR